jgi:hypothetical protein
MALELFVLKMALINIVSRLKMEGRAVNCRLEELMGV